MSFWVHWSECGENPDWFASILVFGPARTTTCICRTRSRSSRTPSPVTYAYDALAKVTADNTGTWLWLDIVIVAGTQSLPCRLFVRRPARCLSLAREREPPDQ